MPKRTLAVEVPRSETELRLLLHVPVAARDAIDTVVVLSLGDDSHAH